jgi:hypothetical protein
MARNWKAWTRVVAWLGVALGLALPARAQLPGTTEPPPPAPIGYSNIAVMVPVLPTSGQPYSPMPTSLHGGPSVASIPGEDSCFPSLASIYATDNAFDEEEHEAWPLRCQVSFDYLLLWFRSFHLPATATEGDINDAVPGAAFQPGTKLLHGKGRDSFGPSDSFRVTWTSWLKHPEHFGFEASFMIMEQRTLGFTFASDNNGDPVLSRPYFDPVVNQPNADPRSVTATKRGVIRDYVQHRLMGAEGGPKFRLSGGDSTSNTMLLTMTVGPRWLKVDEKFFTDDFTQDLPLFTGQTFLNIQDNFTAYNEFIGGQIAFQARQRIHRGVIDLITKVAVGPNYQTGQISGFTRVRDESTRTITTAPQGLYAQPTNIGVYRQEEISIVPEFGVNFGYFITPNFKFSVGYGTFWMSNVLRPSSLIDTTVNIQPLNVETPIPPLRPGRPRLESSDFWAQWVNLSFEFMF